MKILRWNEFLNEKVQPEISQAQKEVRTEEAEIAEKPNLRNAYREFFSSKLKKFGVKGIGQLKDKRSEFFKEIKAEWTKHKESMVKESSGDLPEYALIIKNEISKLKKGPAGGTIDLGKTFGKDVSQTDIKNMLMEYPDAEVFYDKGCTLLKLKD